MWVTADPSQAASGACCSAGKVRCFPVSFGSSIHLCVPAEQPSTPFPTCHSRSATEHGAEDLKHAVHLIPPRNTAGQGSMTWQRSRTSEQRSLLVTPGPSSPSPGHSLRGIPVTTGSRRLWLLLRWLFSPQFLGSLSSLGRMFLETQTRQASPPGVRIQAPLQTARHSRGNRSQGL